MMKADFEILMQPFWISSLMHGESVMMVADGNGPAEAPLLFEPAEILSVKNSHLDIEYEEGRDWTFEGGRLKLAKGSRAAHIRVSDLYPEKPSEKTMPKLDGGYVLFSEGSYIHDLQLSVTYKHNSCWTGPVPGYQGNKLPKTMQKLKRGEGIRLVLYGDSISVGANASGFTGAPPYLPVWGRLVADSLQKAYHIPVQFINPSVGGTMSGWGRDNVKELACAAKPDITIIAFGMNDGSARISRDVFRNNIADIMEQITRDAPESEFILVSSILANPETSFAGCHEDYIGVLESLAGKEGTAMVNMTSIHKELLKHKRLIDMTGNNINHPNDFLVRWYAQSVSAALILHLPEQQ